MRAPATEWVDPRRFAEWVGHGFSAQLAERMLANTRLRARSMDLVGNRLGSPSPSATQSAALSLDSAGLTRLAGYAGAIWHAKAIVRLIDGIAVRNLIAAIGGELRSFAINNVVLAPPVEGETTTEAIPEDIRLDGNRCLAAWCAARPIAVGTRVALRLADDTPPEQTHRTFGPAIIDSALEAIRLSQHE